MSADWNSKKYELSLTRRCLSSAGHEAEAACGDLSAGMKDAEIRRLFKLERSLEPVPRWAAAICEQIARLPAFGWALPHCIEAVCQNIGAGAPAEANPSACYHIGPHRLQLMTDYAICLEGWLKEHSPETISAQTSEMSLGWRDWEFIARRIQDALGSPSRAKSLLVRRLLAKLRFWLRASQAETGGKTREESRVGQYVSETRDEQEDEMAELDRQVRHNIHHGERWLELIDSAWPGAARIFHYIERMMAAIGERDVNPDAWPDELVDVDLEPAAATQKRYQAADPAKVLYDTVLKVLDDYLDGQSARVADAKAAIDAAWAERLARRLGEPTLIGTFLVAVTKKRFVLLAAGSKQMV